MRKLLLSLTVMGLCAMSSVSYAYGVNWVSRSSGMDKMLKVLIFPVEGNAPVQAQEILGNQSKKADKKITFHSVARKNSQVSAILEDNHVDEALLQTFPNEEARGAAVRDKALGDAYIICKIRENRVQRDWAPEVSEEVEMKTYTERKSDQGTERYDEHTWNEWHTIPGQYVNLQILDVDYLVYDTNGKRIMTYTDSRRSYADNAKDQFTEITKEFYKAMKENFKVTKAFNKK